MISRRCAGVMTLPKFSWLMRPFWQNTQPKLQPEKKMQPAPFFPLRTGSSQRCSIARDNEPRGHAADAARFLRRALRIAATGTDLAAHQSPVP